MFHVRNKFFFKKKQHGILKMPLIMVNNCVKFVFFWGIPPDMG